MPRKSRAARCTRAQPARVLQSWRPTLEVREAEPPHRRSVVTTALSRASCGQRKGHWGCGRKRVTGLTPRPCPRTPPGHTHQQLQLFQVRQGLAQQPHTRRLGGQEHIHGHGAIRGSVRDVCRPNQRGRGVGTSSAGHTHLEWDQSRAPQPAASGAGPPAYLGFQGPAPWPSERRPGVAGGPRRPVSSGSVDCKQNMG